MSDRRYYVRVVLHSGAEVDLEYGDNVVKALEAVQMITDKLVKSPQDRAGAHTLIKSLEIITDDGIETREFVVKSIDYREAAACELKVIHMSTAAPDG